jgi:hypothetical protein
LKYETIVVDLIKYYSMVYKVPFKAGHSVEVSHEIADVLWEQLGKSANATRLYSRCLDDNENYAVINVLDISLIEPIYE